jgi:hypothetical protein
VTETEQWVNDTCERIVAGGVIWLYRDLYKDLRQTLPCGLACRLIRKGLVRTHLRPVLAGVPMPWRPIGERTRACAALHRLERYEREQDWDERVWIYYGE